MMNEEVVTHNDNGAEDAKAVPKPSPPGTKISTSSSSSSPQPPSKHLDVDNPEPKVAVQVAEKEGGATTKSTYGAFFVGLLPRWGQKDSHSNHSISSSSSENEKTAQSAHLQSSFFGSLLGRKPVRSHSSSSGSEGLFSGWFDSKPSKLDGKEEMDTSSSTHSKAGRVDHKTKHRNTQVKSKVDLGDHNPKADKAESSTPSAPQGGEANFFSNIVTPLPKLLERFFGPKASDMFIASSESSSISSEDESDQSSSPSSPRKQENKQVSPPAVAEQDEVVVKIGGGGTHLIELTEESSSSGPHKGEQRLGYRIVKKRAKKVPTDTTSTSSTVCIINKTEISQHS